MTENSPSLETVGVRLRTGEVAEMRPVLPTDAPLFIEGLAALSENSRFARFGMGIDHLSGNELRYLTDVDQRSHVAVGATVDDEPAGVGRYVIVPEESCGEVAVTVVDDYQRRGLGKALFSALVAIARHDGIDRFCFEVSPANAAVRRLLKGVVGSQTEGGLWEGVVEIADLPEAPEDRAIVDLVERYRRGDA